MLHRGFRAHYKQISKFERGLLSDRKKLVGRIQQSLDIWIEVMQQFNVADKKVNQQQQISASERHRSN